MSNGFEKSYSRTYWVNNTPPAINEANLNNLEKGVSENDNRIVTLDKTKLDQATANGMVKSWVIDTQTGIINVTYLSGQTSVYDLNLEKIPAKLELSEDGIITMTTDDGTKMTANIADLIPIITFNSSDTISVSVTGTGKDKTYSFNVKNGSITGDMLEPNYLADVTVQAGRAEASANSASTSSNESAYNAKLSQSYAIGTGGEIRENDDEDCAKAYYEKAKEVSSVQIATTDVAGIVKPDGNTIGVETDGTIKTIGMENMQNQAFPFTVAQTEGNIDPANTIGENMGLLLKSQSAFRQDIQSVIDKLNNIKTDLPYNNYQEFISAFNGIPSNMYKVGQGILIGALGVPDLSVFSLESSNVPYNYTTDEQFIEDIKAGGDTHPYVQVGYYNITIKEGEKTNLEPINALLGATDISKTGDGTLTGIAKRNYDLLGTTSISGIGDGTATGAISALNNNLPKQIDYWTTTPRSALNNINDISDKTFRTIIVNAWDTGILENEVPVKNRSYHVILFNNNNDYCIWQLWTSLEIDIACQYIRQYNPQLHTWGTFIEM